MKQYEINMTVRSVDFDEDGIYTVGSNHAQDVNYFEMSDDELTTLKNNINKITLPQIVDDDVIYFDKKATFPKLLLGRLDLKVKRTIKIDKCNKIVVNEDSILNQSNIKKIYSGYLIFVGGKDETDYNQLFFISKSVVENSEKEDNISLELMQRYFPGIWKEVICIPDNISLASLDLINTHPEKITTVQNVAIYLNSQLPKLDDESAKTMVSLFKSGSEEKKLAVNMIASFNISTVLFDICQAISGSTGYFDEATKASINYKYFRLLLGINPLDLESRYRYGSYYQYGIVSKIFHNPLISPEQKLKAWRKFKNTVSQDSYISSSNERVRNQFAHYNIPLEYDPERETITSDSEVE